MRNVVTERWFSNAIYSRALKILGKYSKYLSRRPSKSLKAVDSGKPLMLQIFSMRLGVKGILLLLGLIYSLFGLIVPITQSMAVDALSKETAEFSEIALLFLFGLLALCTNQTLAVFISMICQREGVLVDQWLSQALYRKALTLQSEFQGQRSVGEVVALTSSHLPLVNSFLSELFPAFFISFIPIVIAPFALKFFFGFDIAPILIVVFLTLLLNVLMAKWSARLFESFKLLSEERLGIFNEWIQNILMLRALGWTDAFEQKCEHITKQNIRQRSKAVKWAALMNNISGTMPMALNLIAVLTVLYVHKVPLTSGEVMGILWVLGIFLIVPMRTLPWVFVQYFDASMSLKRIGEYLRFPSYDQGLGYSATYRPSVTTKGPSVKVKGLTRSIDNKVILDNIDMEVREAEFVAIVGEIGSGKTQLLKSLCGETSARFKEFSIGERNVLDISHAELRSHFAMVAQDPFAFAATVRENVALTYADEHFGTNLDQVREALTLAAFNHDLAMFPAGLDTALGERGVNLSGGQKQRLELARAYFHDRPIIILDDPFSALDAKTEQEIVVKLLSAAWSNKTRIMVTHRLSVLEKVDRVFFMKGGKIVVQGGLESLAAHAEFQNFIRNIEDESNG